MITVIIPTYKPKSYLWKCLDSLEIQTIDKSRYEVIIILNGFRNPYYDQIKQGLSRYSMNVCLEHTDVSGVSNARNIGLDMAKGNYICFIDDDDWVSNTYLESLYTSAHDSGLISVSNVAAVEFTSGKISPDYLSDVYMSLRHKKIVGLIQARRLLSSSCCKMIPKEIIGKNMFDVRITRGEDSLFMAKISNRIKGVAIADSGAIYYRLLRPSSASRSTHNLKQSICDFLLLEYCLLKMYLCDLIHYHPVFFLGRLLAVFKGTILKYFVRNY